MQFKPPEQIKIGVAGLGYVGLPLALAFAEHYPTIGFDIKKNRIEDLIAGREETGEIELEKLTSSSIHFAWQPGDLAGCNVYILAIPTPVTHDKQPDWTQLNQVLYTIAPLLKKNDVVVIESTVYPGATEELLMPLLSKASGLEFNRDFFAGYSPERINPGDHKHKLADIVKLTSGSTTEVADFVDALYAKIIRAGTFKTSSIKIAEAAKAIENAQRDINIAFVNELSMIFSRLGIETSEVLKAAGTKWNFLNFSPGLVGGHCIGVDPYYLAFKAQQAGHIPEIILAGRKVNDQMPSYLIKRITASMQKRRIDPPKPRVLVLGIAFKENCRDVRNSGAADLIIQLQKSGMDVSVFDPVVSPELVKAAYGIELETRPKENHYHLIILAIGHGAFQSFDPTKYRTDPSLVFDIKGFFSPGFADECL